MNIPVSLTYHRAKTEQPANKVYTKQEEYARIGMFIRKTHRLLPRKPVSFGAKDGG